MSAPQNQQAVAPRFTGESHSGQGEVSNTAPQNQHFAASG
jgi:hypothetical protein